MKASVSPGLLALLALIRGCLAFSPPTIPLNWTTQYPCAVDTPSRILSGVVTTTSESNTVASCIERCDAGEYIYAGVEYGNECHCGKALVSSVTAAPASDCNTPCSGDAATSCGGSFRIQIYKSPALTSGSSVGLGCFVDEPGAPAFAEPVVHRTFPNSTNVVENCIHYCTHIGYPYRGIEDTGADCQCAFGFAEPRRGVDIGECSGRCPFGPPGSGLDEGCGAPQRMLVFEDAGWWHSGH